MFMILSSLLACFEPPAVCSNGFADLSRLEETTQFEHFATFRLTSDAPGELFHGVWSTIEVRNVGAEESLVAVYISDVPPDEATIPTLSAVDGAPEFIDGLGELWFEVFLNGGYDSENASTYLGNGAEESFSVSGAPVDAYVTIVTDNNSFIEGGMVGYPQYCERPRNQEFSETDAQPDTFSLVSW